MVALRGAARHSLRRRVALGRSDEVNPRGLASEASLTVECALAYFRSTLRFSARVSRLALLLLSSAGEV